MENAASDPPVWVQFVPLFGVCLIMIYPSARILKRVGISRWYALLMIFPFFWFISIWIFAFLPWPAMKDRISQAFE